MGRYIHIEDLVEKVRKEGLKTLVDKVSFSKVLVIWILITASFGFFYFFFNNETSYLYQTTEAKVVDQLSTSVYYSFIAATTTGFGDIIPIGYFKLIAVLQVVIGLLLLALVTSKLVSIKQDMILDGLYELSVNGHVSKIRSSLLLFRQNLDRVLSKIEDKTLTPREVHSLHGYFSALEDTLNEINPLLFGKNKQMLKVIDPVNIELIANSIISSLRKIDELIVELENSNVQWKTDLDKKLLESILGISSRILSQLENAEISKRSAKEIYLRFSDVKNKIEPQIK